MLTRRRLAGLALACLALVTAACGDNGLSAREKKVSAKTTPTSTTTTVTPPVGRVSRIVSLSPSATEMLFAIGAKDQVVAVDSLSNYPTDTPLTDLNAFEPNVEAITSYEPDLVITDGTNQKLLDQLNAVHVATLALAAPKSLDGAFQEIEKLGAATGDIAQAAGLVANLQAEVQGILATFPKQPGQLRYYYELDQTYYTAASTTFIGTVLKLLNLKNVADPLDTKKTGGYPQLTSEFIVQANPDVIFLADGKCCQQTPDSVAARPGWSDIRAVQENHIIMLDDDVASRWGPRIVDLLRQVADAIKNIKPIVDDTLSS